MKGTKYRPRGSKKAKKGDIPQDIQDEAAKKDMTPLEYMLSVMNDEGEDKDLRARMAVAAAPYMHSRKGEGAGKKDEQGARAKAAAGGKFAAGAPPLKVVK